ncbi:outer membrane autotransporter barrel domain protein [Burkholderia sp. H160]|nr:outer membrane autotransporter barrel domain protein [Burkholderia sp. H160]
MVNDMKRILFDTTKVLTLCAITIAVRAQSISNGQTVIVPDTRASPWDLGSTTLSVGQSGQGTLIIHNGGIVSNGQGYVAQNVGSSGSVTVSDPGSTWTSNGEFRVGNNGPGSLTISNGGTVVNNSTNNSSLGYMAAGIGTGLVTDAGSVWRNSGPVLIANSGQGTLTIENQGSVISSNGVFAQSTGSSASATVTGDGSTWTMSGSATVGNAGAGALLISNGAVVTTGQTASLASQVTGSGTVTVTGSGSTWTIGGNLIVSANGQATLNIENGGQVSAPAVIIAQHTGTGTLNIGAAAGDAPVAPGQLSAATVTFGAGTGTIVFNHTDTSGGYTFAPAVSGPGSVNVLNGVTVLTGNSTYTGGTAISGATLELGNGGSSGSITGNVANNGALAFNRSNTLTLAGVISGTGTVAQNGGGTTVLTGDSTYTGGTTISAGALQLGNGGTSGSITGNVTNNGTLAFNRSNTLTFGGVISGTGTVAQNGGGTTVLTANSTYTGGTTISAGTLQLGNGGTSGSITGNVTNNGTLAFNRSGTLIFDNVISGTGSVLQDGPGNTILTGNNTYTGGTTISDGTLELGNGGTSGSIAGVVSNDRTLEFDRSDTLTFGGIISGPGGVTQHGSGTTILTAASAYSGPTVIQRGTLAAGAADVFSPNSNFAVESGGTLALQGFDQTVPGLTNAGLVRTSGDPGTVLTTGSYIGNGGTLAIDTFLGDDSSPSDKLVINGGTASGTTNLAVTNAGGPGALTRGNGIPVVEVTNGGTTATGAFSLAGEVRGGAFDYRLFRGGTGGNLPDDWFLRTDFSVPGPEEPSPPGPEGPTLPAEEVLPPDPPPAVLPPGEYLIIGPELATYSVVQPLARQMGLTALGTLHERIGDTLTPAGGGNDNPGWGRSGWARVFGQQIDNRYRTFSDARASGSLVGVQAGVDIWRGSFLPGHHDAAGVYFAYGNSSADVDGLVTNAAATGYVLQHTGSVNLNGYAGGAYWTHYGPGGWYIDAVLQGTYYDGHASTQFARLPVSGSGLLTSVEAGYPIPLPLGPGFVLEPQLQLIWQHVGLDEANDGLGTVDPGSTSGVTGRLGVRGQWTITRANGQVWQPYVRTNLWRDWGAEATTTFSGVSGELLEQRVTRMDVAVGVTARLDTRMSLYSQFGYQFSINASSTGSRKGVWGDIGLRYAW